MEQTNCPGGAHILVVDDEPLIRMATAATLEDLGCKALVADCAIDALAKLQHNPEVEVLFTDINMAGPMDGLGLAREVRRTWPHVGIILSSGRELPHDCQLPSGTRFLPKPYFFEDLERIAKRAGC